MREPEQSLTKSEFAYKEVRNRILAGDLQPGTVIPQVTLAGEIGISTTPLREALRRLKSEGLVDLDAHRDARVTPLDLEEARDLLEVRKSLDPLASALAAERRTKADIAEIRAAHENLEPLSGDPDIERLIAHRRFHAALYFASHNEILISMLEGLWDKADRYRRLGLEVSRTEEEIEKTREQHKALMECVIDRDSEGAARVMIEHIEKSLGASVVWRLNKDSAMQARGGVSRSTRGGPDAGFLEAASRHA